MSAAIRGFPTPPLPPFLLLLLIANRPVELEQNLATIFRLPLEKESGMVHAV